MIIDWLSQVMVSMLDPVLWVVRQIPAPPRSTQAWAGNIGNFAIAGPVGIASGLVPWTGILGSIGFMLLVSGALHLIRLVLWILALFHISGDE